MTLKNSARRSRKGSAKFLFNQSTMRLMTLGASICMFAGLLAARHTEAGRIQDFIQSIVGSNRNNNNSNNNNNESSSSNSDSSDTAESNTNSDTTASNQQQQQAMDPMMSAAMSQFMRYPSFYGSFAPNPGYGGFPAMSFSNPMAAMSSFSPLAMSTNSLGAFGPASFSPASLGSAYGSNPMSSYGTSGGLSNYGGSATGAGSGMSASSLSNVFASAPNFMSASGYAPYYGRRK